MVNIPFGRIAVIGCGLIGSSVLRAVRTQFPGVWLVAVEADANTREYVVREGWADQVSDTYTKDMAVDLVVLAVPIPALGQVAEAIGPLLTPGAVVTDTASVKRVAVEAVAPYLPEGTVFIPGHPIAGSEQSGAWAGRAELFAGKRVILTPEAPPLLPPPFTGEGRGGGNGSAEYDVPSFSPLLTSPRKRGEELANEAALRVADFWRALGAEVVFMPPELHDRVYAVMSHLPQLLAFVVKEMDKMFHVKHSLNDLTARFVRLQASDRHLWERIFTANKEYIDKALNRYLEALHQIIHELMKGQEEASASLDDSHAEALFPYIVASCLVSTVAREEKAIGTSLRPFAGTGFADFTAPLEQNPEMVMESASMHAQALARLLEKFADSLVAWR